MSESEDRGAAAAGVDGFVAFRVAVWHWAAAAGVDGFVAFRVAVWHWLPACLVGDELAPAMVAAVERALGRPVTKPKPDDPLWANAAIDVIGWALAAHAQAEGGRPLADTTLRVMLPPEAFARLTPIMRSRIVRCAEAQVAAAHTA